MKIIELEAQNVKRLRAFHIRPDGSSVTVTGKNGTGKTTVLDLISYAFGGKGEIPAEPITRGEEKALIVATTEGLIVTRKFSANGKSTIEVTNRDGLKYPSPQTMLDQLLGSLSFDPLEFSRAHAKNQAKTLQAVLGLNFDKLDEHRQHLYDARRDINQDIKRRELEHESAEHHPEITGDFIEPVELAKELTERQRRNHEHDVHSEKYARMVVDHADERANLVRLEESIERETHDLHRYKGIAKKKAQEIEEMRKQLDGHQRLDEKEILDQLADAEEHNRKLRVNAHRDHLHTDLQALCREADSRTDQIQKVDDGKERSVAAASTLLPIAGLGFGEDGVVFNDLPLEQASSAEQLRVSVALGLALNPKLRVLLIRDGSLLDEDSLRMVAEMAAEKDAQLFLERVGSEDEVKIIIEDGSVEAGVDNSD